MGRPKKATKSPPLMDNEHVKELLSILDANNMQDKNDQLYDVISYIGSMEYQLKEAVRELAAMRQELAVMREESHPFKTAMQNAVRALEKNNAALRERLEGLKQNVIEGCKKSVAAFKEKGLSALRNIAEFFNLRPGLEALRDDLDKGIKRDEARIGRIETMSTDYHEAGRHLKNIGRAIMGKEAVQDAKPIGMLAKTMEVPFRIHRARLVMMQKCVGSFAKALNRLEETERKPPIMETINKLNEQIAQAKKDAPTVERPRPVVHDGR